MITPLFSMGATGAPSVSATNYNSLVNDPGNNWNATEATQQQVIAVPGLIRYMRVVLETAPGAAKSYVFTLRKNGVDTGLTVTISGASQTTGEISTTDVAVVAGDLLSISSVPSGTPASSQVSMSFVFDAQAANKSPWLMINGNGSAAGRTIPQGGSGFWGTTIQSVMPTAGTVKNMYLKCQTAPGAGKSFTITLMKNGVNQSLTATISDTNTTGNDTSNSVSFVAGDQIAYVYSSAGAPTAPVISIGVEFNPTVDGESVVLSGADTGSPPSVSATNYGNVIGNNGFSGAVELTTKTICPCALIFKNLYVNFTTAPGAAKSFQMALRKNNATTALSVTITGAGTTTGNNTSDNITAVPDDVINFISIPSGTPTAPGELGYSIVVMVSAAYSLAWRNPATLGYPMRIIPRRWQPFIPIRLTTVAAVGVTPPTAPSRYAIELRDKDFNLKARLEPFVSTLSWEWNRIGGCGRATMTVHGDYLRVNVQADDDIRIYLPDAGGTTATLWYRGFVSSAAPALSSGDSGSIQIECQGYFGFLDRILIQDSNEEKVYSSQEVSATVTSIINSFVVPNSSVTLGTVDASDFTPDSLTFKVSAKEALKTCFDLLGNIEYGVDASLQFYWRNRSDTILKKFYLGGNVVKLSDQVDFKGIINSIYFEGGDSGGVPFLASGAAADSITKFGLHEELLSNGAINTNAVAQQYISAILTQMAVPQRQLSVSLKNINTRFEATLPIGTISIVDPDNTQSAYLWGKTVSGGSNKIWGRLINLGSGILWGSVRKEQIDRISYTLSPEDGRVHADVQFGTSVAFSRASATLKRIEQIQSTLQQRSR